MPLPEPSPRTRLHTRQIQCHGYARDDGLWDIEAQIVDTKSYDFPNQYRGTVYAGEPVHDMWLRLTLDDRLCIKNVAAKTDASPYRACPEIGVSFKRLIGIRIKRGWRKQANELLGGVKGCTHLFELLPVVATVAFQTIFSAKNKIAREQGLPKQSLDVGSLLLNSCHAFSEDGDMVKEYYPELYKS